MKRPLQLSLAITLALCGTNALALGLGPARVYSKLNQPLNAEIPVIQGNAGEAEGLLVNLASAEDFERIGLSRSRLHVPLEFAIGKDAQGATVIKVTSKEPVRDSYLDFLVEANWPKGRLLREYTMLLDPPLTAPSRAAAAAPAAPARSAAPAPARETAATTPAPVHAARSAPRPAPAAKVADGEYGPVASGETLFEIARANAPGSNVNQTMLALLKGNPDAFYKDNINALKRGAILRMPSAEDLKAVGSAQAAAAAVQAQAEDWRGGKASPALVADGATGKAPAPAVAGAKTSKASATGARSDDERLQLVPPKAGKDSLAMADRPGSGAGSAAATADIKAELARTRESLTASEQESGELKSRVQALEDLKSKNDRLISLKDSEIAELQQKLKQLQSTSTPASAPAAPAPAAAAPVAAPEEPIDKNDIWGKDGAPAEGTAAPAAKGDAPAPAAAAAPSPTPAPAAVSDPLASAPPATSSPAAAPAPAASAPESAAVAAPATTSPAAETLPLAEAPPSTPVTNAAKPAVAPKPAVTPAVAAPWYSEPWVKPGALGAGVLLLLLGLLGLRKRKAEPVVPRNSIADSFGDSPLGSTSASDPLDDDEQDLIAQLQDEPENAGLHLELLSVYYAKRDVERFEQEAALMHERIHDPHQAEWIEAQAMGQELAPHNPLFSAAGHYDAADVDSATAHSEGDVADEFESASFADVPAHARGDGAAQHEDAAAVQYESRWVEPAHDAFADVPAVEPVHDALDAESDLGFGIAAADLADPPAAPPPVPAPASADELGFDLPPLDFDDVSPSQAVADPVAEQAPALDLDDDYFAGEDAIGTKLDLAKAYMDMGDPEGARSMLDEVLAEGGDEQQAEARRLMAELG